MRELDTTKRYRGSVAHLVILLVISPIARFNSWRYVSFNNPLQSVKIFQDVPWITSRNYCTRSHVARWTPLPLHQSMWSLTAVLRALEQKYHISKSMPNVPLTVSLLVSLKGVDLFFYPATIEHFLGAYLQILGICLAAGSSQGESHFLYASMPIETFVCILAAPITSTSIYTFNSLDTRSCCSLDENAFLWYAFSRALIQALGLTSFHRTLKCRSKPGTWSHKRQDESLSVITRLRRQCRRRARNRELIRCLPGCLIRLDLRSGSLRDSGALSSSPSCSTVPATSNDISASLN